MGAFKREKKNIVDITTGLIVSHYCFMVVDGQKEFLDNLFRYWYERSCGMWTNEKIDENKFQ